MSDQNAQRAPAERHPTRKWIVATIVLLAVAIGLGAWALSLRSDVDDKDAQIAAQQQQLEEQQNAGDRLREAAGGAAEDVEAAFGELSGEIEQIRGVATDTQQQVEDAIAGAEQAAADAQERIDGAADEVEEARAQADAAAARADEAGACARGYLSAFAGVFDAESISDGLAQAKDDVAALQGSCADALGG